MPESVRLLLYDVMLKLQVDAAFPYEREILKKSSWEGLHSILDFGCGNGYFLSRIAEDFNPSVLGGVDHDPGFVQRAHKSFGGFATFYSGLPEAPSPALQATALILRLVLHHLADPLVQLSALLHQLPDVQHIYVVNPCDKHFRLSSGMASFMRDLKHVRQDGSKRRDIHPGIVAHLASQGFAELQTAELVIKADSLNAKNEMFTYMYATAVSGDRTSPRPDTLEELVEWLLDRDATAQYGLVCSSFRKVEEPANQFEKGQ